MPVGIYVAIGLLRGQNVRIVIQLPMLRHKGGFDQAQLFWPPQDRDWHFSPHRTPVVRRVTSKHPFFVGVTRVSSEWDRKPSSG